MVDCCLLQSLDFHFGGLLLTPTREERVLGAVGCQQPQTKKEKLTERKKTGTKLKRSMSDKLLAPKPAIAKVEPSQRRRLRASLSLVIPNCITDDSAVDGNMRRPHSGPQFGRRCMSLDIDKFAAAHPPPFANSNLH